MPDRTADGQGLVRVVQRGLNRKLLVEVVGVEGQSRLSPHESKEHLSLLVRELFEDLPQHQHVRVVTLHTGLVARVVLMQPAP